MSDGDADARVVALSTVEGGLITHQVEYWLSGYEPMPGREHLTSTIPRVP